MLTLLEIVKVGGQNALYMLRFKGEDDVREHGIDIEEGSELFDKVPESVAW
jgi:hypothetical protein